SVLVLPFGELHVAISGVAGERLVQRRVLDLLVDLQRGLELAPEGGPLLSRRPLAAREFLPGPLVFSLPESDRVHPLSPSTGAHRMSRAGVVAMKCTRDAADQRPSTRGSSLSMMLVESRPCARSSRATAIAVRAPTMASATVRTHAVWADRGG